MIDDLTLLHQLEKAKTANGNFLFTPKSAYRTRGSGGKKSNKAGTNLENGVITYFNIPDFEEKKDSVYLSYHSVGGDTLASFFNHAKEKKDQLKLEEGANKFVWNMETKGAEKLDGMILWWASLDGAKVIPGTYRVKLNINGAIQNQNFEILPDPRTEVTIEQMEEQYMFVSEVNKTIDKAHQSIKKIRKINTQLEDFIKQYGKDEDVKELVEKAKELKETLTEIEEALYQTKNKSNQDPLNFPIKLTNKLGHLNSLVTMDDFPPTVQDIAVQLELSKQIEKQLAAFDELIKMKYKALTLRLTN